MIKKLLENKIEVLLFLAWIFISFGAILSFSAIGMIVSGVFLFIVALILIWFEHGGER